MVSARAKRIINSTKPTFPNIPKKSKEATQLGAAGYDNPRDDIEKVKNLREGTVEKVPANELDIVNKAYVDSIAGRPAIELFLTENASDIGTYFDLEVNVVTAAKENIVQSITASSTTLIASFASILNEASINEITVLESGVYSAHLHALGATANNLFLYFEFYHRTAGGTETLLGTSHDSGELTTSELGYELHASITTDKAFVSGDRIVIKVYGRNNSAAARNVTIYMEGDTAARVEFPGISSTSFLRNIVEDTTPELGGEMDAGAHTIGFTQQTATGDGTTTIDWKLGNKFYFTFGAQNDTFTFTAPSNPCNLILVLKQDGTGSRIPTFPGTVLWSGGAMPTFSTGIAAVDIVAFYYDGTNYFGVDTLDFS